MPSTLRFGDVAHAIGTTQKTLRNWLQREQVLLSSPAPEDRSWREFELDDIPQLALVKTFVGFGMEVRQADSIAREILARSAIVSIDEHNALRVEPVHVAIWPIAEGWQAFPYDEGNEDELLTETIELDAVLFIKAGKVVFAALQRALERIASTSEAEAA